jgi:hypothetical protein
MNIFELIKSKRLTAVSDACVDITSCPLCCKDIWFEDTCMNTYACLDDLEIFYCNTCKIPFQRSCNIYWDNNAGHVGDDCVKLIIDADGMIQIFNSLSESVDHIKNNKVIWISTCYSDDVTRRPCEESYTLWIEFGKRKTIKL